MRIVLVREPQGSKPNSMRVINNSIPQYSGPLARPKREPQGSKPNPKLAMNNSIPQYSSPLARPKREV